MHIRTYINLSLAFEYLHLTPCPKVYIYNTVNLIPLVLTEMHTRLDYTIPTNYINIYTCLV